MSLPLCIIVLTHNEATNLPRCLRALPDGVETVVVDSGSSDGTREIAMREGARVLEHPFLSFGEQRNWALDSANISQAWVLFLDADEEATPAFWEAVEGLMKSDHDERVAGVFCCWKMMLRGRWLKRSDSFPKWQLRLLRRGRVRFIDVGHGQKEGRIDGETTYLTEPYLHHAFSKGWHDWLDKHNRYSTQEAHARVSAPQGSWGLAMQAKGSERNTLLKPLVSKLPFWPVLRFLHGYVWKGGWLEGRAGLDYAVLMAFYEYLIQLKMRDQVPEHPSTISNEN